jgi:hypothetical protein
VFPFSLQVLLETFFFAVIIIKSVIFKVNSKMPVGHHVNCPLLLLNFNQNWHVLADFNKNSLASNFVKIW